MFEKSLTALIKGLRSYRGRDEATYLAGALAEVRTELQSGDMEVKTEAVLKLAYLQMLGYEVRDAGFPILETMASTRFHAKSTGYLAAALCFTPDTDVLILATNLIKKDLHSAAPLDVAAALTGLSHVITQELAQHLAADISLMLTHTRPAIRKRAVLVLYSAITKCPEILERTWERLRDRLSDPDTGVATAAVNAVCELARRNPAPFLPLAPQLFHILTTTTNNWLLIKVLKLFGALAPIEPRLVRRLASPISEILATTPAMSVLYECIHSAIVGGMLHGARGEELATRCVENLARFLGDADQNLRYIALLALVKMLPTHAHLVAAHQDTILRSLAHPDLTIRLRALDLACGLAARANNLEPVVSALLEHVVHPRPSAPAGAAAALDALSSAAALGSASDDTPFRVQVAESILDLGSAHGFAGVRDPEWYQDVLLRLAHMPELGVSTRAADQLVELAHLRADARSSACERAETLLLQHRAHLFTRAGAELLRAAAWVCGEYAHLVDNPSQLARTLLCDELRQPSLPSASVAVAMQAGVKLCARWTAGLASAWDMDALQTLRSLCDELSAQLTRLAEHDAPEVHQRATEFLHLFVFLRKGLEGAESAPPAADPAEKTPPRALHLLEPLLYTQDLDEVDPDAYVVQPLPASVHLDAWIVPPARWAAVHAAVEPAPPKAPKRQVPSTAPPAEPAPRRSSAYREDDPFYLSSGGKKKPSSRRRKESATAPADEDEELRSIPIVQLDLSDLGSSSTPPPPDSEPARVQPKVVARKKKDGRRRPAQAS